MDDGSIEGRRGSVAIDDEGVPGQYNVLIENGILKGYMQDKMNARLMGVKPTGNGRRESYAHLPSPVSIAVFMRQTLVVGKLILPPVSLFSQLQKPI